MHNQNITHRDIKPENILLESKDKDSLEVKIADFGFSCIFDPQEGLDLVLGSPLYMAPELILGRNYGPKVDIWAIGVISYMLLSGKNPFPGKNKEAVRELITSKDVDLGKAAIKNISAMAKDFIRKALIRDPEERYSAKELLDHEWIQKNSDLKDTPLDDGETSNVLENL